MCVQWINFKLLILYMRFICCRFSLLYIKLESIEHHDIHSAGNRKMESSIAWHSHQNLQYEDFWVFKWQSKNRFIFMWMKPNTQAKSWCLGRLLSMVLLCFYSSFYMTSDSSAILDQEGVCWKNLRSATKLCAMPNKQENPVLVVWEFLRLHTLPPNFKLTIFFLCLGHICEAKKIYWKQE